MEKSAITSQTLEVENVGPINGSFKIDMPEPGLYELRGSKGRGKSTVLSALSMLSGHKVAITVNDDEVDGQVSGFGTVVPVGARRKRVGELEANVIDSAKFDLIDLIDPQGKTPQARDNVRLKALAALSGLKLAPKDFYPAAGGKAGYDALAVNETDDPVLFTQRVKDKIDAQAKTLEQMASQEEGHAAGLEEQYKELDLGGEHDADTLNAGVQQAVSAKSRLLEQVTQRAIVLERVTVAKERLAAAKADNVFPLEEIEKELRVYQGEIDQSHKDEQQLRDQIGELERQCMRITQGRSRSEGNLKLAQEKQKIREGHESVIIDLEEEINQEMIPAVSGAEVEQADLAVIEAQDAQDQGVRIRDAIRAKRGADAHREQSSEYKKESAKLRSNAQTVFDVIGKKMTLSHIRIKNFSKGARLVVDHARGKNTKLDQDDGLSDGERVKVCITELLPRLESPGIFPIPQRTYQDLPPADRIELSQYAKEHGLYLFGAQVTDGDLEVVRVEEQTG